MAKKKRRRTPRSAVSAIRTHTRDVEKKYVGDYVQDLIDFDNAKVITVSRKTARIYLVSVMS